MLLLLLLLLLLRLLLLLLLLLRRRRRRRRLLRLLLLRLLLLNLQRRSLFNLVVLDSKVILAQTLPRVGIENEETPAFHAVRLHGIRFFAGHTGKPHFELLVIEPAPTRQLRRREKLRLIVRHRVKHEEERLQRKLVKVRRLQSQPWLNVARGQREVRVNARGCIAPWRPKRLVQLFWRVHRQAHRHEIHAHCKIGQIIVQVVLLVVQNPCEASEAEFIHVRLGLFCGGTSTRVCVIPRRGIDVRTHTGRSARRMCTDTDVVISTIGASLLISRASREVVIRLSTMLLDTRVLRRYGRRIPLQ